MRRLVDYSSVFRILKGGKISLIISGVLINIPILSAAPNGGVVKSGSASIVQTNKVTNINQYTQKASINWQNFSIKKDEIVNFNQPNTKSITLNRVVGNEKSIINGALNANGQVWLLNSNGVLFGKNAKINTSGLLATTAKLSDEDFNKGNYIFKDATKNPIINQGAIEVVNNGSVILASKEVLNSGKIKAVKGTIHLSGAKEYSLNLNGNSLVNLKIKKGVLDALVQNSGTIISDGGSIYLSTNAVDELLKGVVNNTGIIEANSLDNLKGYVELFAHGGESNIAGEINAKEGFVETSAKRVKIDDSFRIKANKWLIDPVDFTIAASGGDMSGATLSTNLSTTDVEIQSANGASGTDGNIYVNDTISWNSANKLTLNAYNDIFISKSISASHATGQLALHYGQGALNAGNNSQYHIKAKINLSAGDNFFTKLGSDGVEITWKVITDLGSAGSTTGTDLQGINGALAGNYVLGTDIDASSTSSWNGGEGFTPIGNVATNFTGNFDGLGHTIDGITIDRSSGDYQGFFGYLKNGTIKNFGLTNLSVTGKDLVGGLTGSNEGVIQNIYVSGTVVGNDMVGGLVGFGDNSIQNSYTKVNVSGNSLVGGLIGGIGGGVIQNSYSTGTVTRLSGSNSDFGGLFGADYGGTITNSYYDNEANTNSLMADSATYGKTKAQIISLAKDNWDIQEDNTVQKDTLFLAWEKSDKEYTKIWVLGTKVDSSPVSQPTSPSTSQPTSPSTPQPATQATPKPKVKPIVEVEPTLDIENIITPIVNQTITKLEPVKITLPQKMITQTNITNSRVVSTPNTKANKLVMLKELQQNGMGETRIPLGDNSLITIVNSGVNLPLGVEQAFYITDEK